VAWRNFPIPDGYATAVLLGVLLQVLVPMRVLGSSWNGHLVGWPIIAAGLLLAWWSVVAVRAVDVDDPGVLVTKGPYAHSRNPMCVAWTLPTLGLGLVLDSLWIVVLEVGALLYTVAYVVPMEEKRLDRKFGAAYTRYCQDVRRFL